MGVFKNVSNRKIKTVHKKGYRYKRVQKAERMKRQGGPMQGEIANPELITAHMLRKRRTSPRANITLSGKKKRKLIKQLKHMQADKEAAERGMDVELVQPVVSKTQKKKAKKAAKLGSGGASTSANKTEAAKTASAKKDKTDSAKKDEDWEDVEMSEEEA